MGPFKANPESDEVHRSSPPMELLCSCYACELQLLFGHFYMDILNVFWSQSLMVSRGTGLFHSSRIKLLWQTRWSPLILVRWELIHILWGSTSGWGMFSVKNTLNPGIIPFFTWTAHVKAFRSISVGLTSGLSAGRSKTPILVTLNNWEALAAKRTTYYSDHGRRLIFWIRICMYKSHFIILLVMESWSRWRKKGANHDTASMLSHRWYRAPLL